jgi:hypothetical protein
LRKPFGVPHHRIGTYALEAHVKRLAPTVLAALAALLVLAPDLSADSPATRQWVLATAKATGLNGEAFVSSLRIVNPNGVAANVSLTFLPQSSIDGSFSALGDNSGRTPVAVVVGAGKTLAIEDVVGTTFGGAAPAGAIQVDSDVPVSVLSRTFVANAKSASGVPGTFGLSIPAQVEAQAVALGDTAFLPYTSIAPTTTSGFRSNFIMSNVARSLGSPISSVLHVKLVRGDGSTVGERDYTLGKLSSAQQTNIAASFGATGEDTNLTLVLTVTSGGPVVIGTSIIDNAISSLNYAPPTKVSRPSGAYGLVLADSYSLAGRLDVANGVPIFLSATIVLEACSGSSTVAYVMQAFTFADPPPNTTFTKNADGTFSFTGANPVASPEASWSGLVKYEVDGSVTGSITYTRASGSAGGTCAGISKTISFAGARTGP